MIKAEEFQLENEISSESQINAKGTIKITKLITLKDFKKDKESQDKKTRDQLVLTKLLSNANSQPSDAKSSRNKLHTFKQSMPSVSKDKGGSSILSSTLLNSAILSTNKDKQ